jgi:hypothetical protein
MVPRTELLDALSAAKAKADDHQASAASAARVQEQLEATRAEADKLREELRKMIKRSDFEAEQKRLRDLEQEARAEAQKLKDSITALNEQLRGLNLEKESLLSELKVHLGH